MELLERFLGSDDSDDDGGSDGDDDMLFDEGDDLDGFGDDGGEFDDGLGFDEGDDGGGAATAELEGRVDELENEVAGLSSTVSTIRSENEEISNTVEDVEENVRKLLDIYEMVTRGVNPFVDDVQGDAGGGFDGGGGGSLGLFDDDSDDSDEEEEDLDDDIAGAEAEEFFDDDFLDDEEEPDGFDDQSSDPIAATTADDTSTTEETMGDSDDSDDSGKSFEELKDEYENGDAEWVGDGDATNGESDAFEEDDDFGGAGEDMGGFEDDADDEFDDTFDDGGIDDSPDPDPVVADGQAAETAPPQEPSPEAAESDGDLQFAANTLMDSEGPPTTKPYLERVPSGYVGDLLVMEWLEYLVEQSDVEDAARAVEYYRRIQWLGEGAADELQEFLLGFGEFDEDVTGAPSGLSIDHHVASLRYISRLTGSTADSIVFECWSGGGGVPFGL